MADRWHLLANLRDAIERRLLRCAGQLCEAARQTSQALQREAELAQVPGEPNDVMPAEPSLKARQRHSSQRRAFGLARYEKVVRRRQAGEAISVIGRTMDLDRRTVRGFMRAGVFPERAPRAAVPSLLDAHWQYVAARAAEGCRNAMQVWRELRARGFTGGRSIVRAAFASLRGARPEGGQLHRVAAAARTMAEPSTRRACACVLG